MLLRGCLLLALLSAPVASDETHVLLIGAEPDHPYATHMYEFECQLLGKCLAKNEGVVAKYVAKWPPTAEQLNNVDAVAFYSSPSGSVVLKDQHRDRFASLMQRKVGFVAIHWGTGVGYDTVSESQHHRDLFLSWLGGWFRRPPCDIKVGRAQLELVDAQHAIGRGWKAWEIRDEFYLNPVLHKRAQPLLQVKVDGEDQVVGWTFLREQQGRSVGITLGHFHHNFAREDFRKILVNSILWAAGRDVPQAGAIAAIAAEDAQLPEPPAEGE